MENKETVCAVVVTYNRKELLIECLEALKKQTRPLEGICLIDNASTYETPKLLLEKGYIKELPSDNLSEPLEKEFEVNNLINGKKIKIHYVRMHENTGGAGGFHEGVRRGYEKGYDWLWLMDDDVKPQNNCLEELLNHKILIYKNTKILPAALACERIYVDREFVGYDCKKLNLYNPFLGFHRNHISEKDLIKQYLEVEGIPFEGMFLNRQIINKIGFPDKRFFIYADDTEYCLRILTIGRIYYIPSAKIIRLIKPSKQNKYNWKSYYEIRNLFYIQLKYSRLGVNMIRIPYSVLRLIFGRIVKKDIVNLPVIFKGLRDAFRMCKTPYDYYS